MAKKSLTNILHKPVHPVLAVAVSLCVVLLIAASPFIMRELSRFDLSFTTPPKITYVHATPVPHITAAPNVPTVIFNQHTFTSPDLGISFDYVDNDKDPIHVQEVGDKVYLNVRHDEPPLGKYVEVFSKNPSDSLTDAVRKRFLQGYSLQNCPILPANLDKRTLNSNYQYVQIALPPLNTYQDRQKCPPVYTYNRQSGIVYYMMDTNHPGKFVFFEIGQDNFLGKPTTDNGITITWDETIRFTGN